MKIKEEKNIGSKLSLSYTALFVSAMFAPFLCRLVLISGRAGLFTPDLHGFISDAAASFSLALLLAFVSSKRLFIGVVIVFIWSLANYGAYEHVMALGALPGFVHAGYLTDKTFLISSALTVSNPALFIAIVTGPIILLWYAFRGGSIRLSLPVLLVPALMLLSINLVWKIDHNSLLWRQTNFLDNNLRVLFTAGADRPAIGSKALELSWKPDLSGKPVVKLSNPGTNVLIIMLESVSGAYIETASDYHNVESTITMPRLSRVAEENIVYRSFVTNQRQTNRGEYALLCGGYPKLNSGVAKMSEYVQRGGSKTCLPQVLKDEGYETVYLQSAPLAFMLKDQFMEAIGFSMVYGDDYFEGAYKRSTWGVDDRAYFEESVKMVEELQGADKPWFLTMLTVGTHDPYIVPDDYASPYKKGSLKEAMGYLDSAVADFIETLEAQGLLKDTLVVITSDESAGITHETSDLLSKLSQNWGFVTIMLPTLDRMKIDDYFMQLDIPLSILDYLGITGRAGEFSGRSLFRVYSGRRRIFFGNTYMRLLGSFDPSGGLNLCDEAFRRCDTFEIFDERWFSPSSAGVAMSREDKETLMAASELSGTISREFKGFEMELISERSVKLSIKDTQLVFGGQQISVPADIELDIELEIEVLSGAGSVKLLNDLVSRYMDGLEEKEQTHFKKVTPVMGPGDRVLLSYSFYTAVPLHKLESRLIGKVIEGEALEIRVIKSSLKAVPCRDLPCGEPGGAGGIRIKKMLLNGVPFGKKD